MYLEPDNSLDMKLKIFLSDKGLGLIVAGFTPTPLETVTEYWPTTPEMLITIGVWATGFFVLTILYKITVSVKEEVAA